MANVSRLKLLEWLRSVLKLDYIRIEQCNDGVAFALLFETLYPGQLQLSHFKFTNCTDYDRIQNLESLKNSLLKSDVPIRIDFDKISRSSPTEIYRLLLWLYNEYHDLHKGRLTTSAKLSDSDSAAVDASEIEKQICGMCLKGDLPSNPRESLKTKRSAETYESLIEEAETTSEKLNASLHEILAKQDAQLKRTESLLQTHDLQQNKIELIQSVIEKYFGNSSMGDAILDIINTSGRPG